MGRDASLAINKNKVSGSVTWSSGITDGSATIAQKLFLQLNVKNITNVAYDTENEIWTFKMNVESCDLDANAKVIIDILYQKRASTATCILDNGKGFFTCTPDIEGQTNDDKFRILYNKRIGSVTYVNDENNLRFEGEADETEIEDKPEVKKDNKDNNDNDNDNNNNLTIIIIVCVVSAVVIAAIIILVVYFVKKKRKNTNEEIKVNKENESKNEKKEPKTDERVIKFE